MSNEREKELLKKGGKETVKRREMGRREGEEQKDWRRGDGALYECR